MVQAGPDKREKVGDMGGDFEVGVLERCKGEDTQDTLTPGTAVSPRPLQLFPLRWITLMCIIHSIEGGRRAKKIKVEKDKNEKRPWFPLLCICLLPEVP